MAEFCSCGAQLPEDALFCHRCGKPQRELPDALAPEPFEEEPAAGPAPQAADASSLEAAFSPEINFHNRVAVRICLFCAVVASVVSSVPLGVLSVFWLLVTLLASGFVAVYLYHRRSGMFLATRAGARMGWMTGLFYWLISMIVFAMKMVAVSGRGGLGALLREQMEASASRDDVNLQEALRILDSPQGMATMVIFVLFFAFLFFTALPAIGGALGSKVLEREN
ncbi:MAG: zinc ribbon domain-containing protein [Bryobacterales bacterium]|nr:zinc ribbon domain-containing protein [Bryobacterales bacterium]